MTPEEINEAVAFKLGWEKVVGPAPMYHTVWIRKGNYGAGQQHAPTYATDIKSAWEIVESLRKEFCFVEVSHDCIRNLWQCSVDHEGPGLLDSFATADTAPLAICMAFLKLS